MAKEKMTSAVKAELKKIRSRSPLSKTRYPGVFYVESASHSRDAKPEKVFYIRYYDPSGKQHFEKAGREIRYAGEANAVKAARSRGKEPTNIERKAQEEAAKAEQAGRWTFDRLWKAWLDDPENEGKRGNLKSDLRYRKHIKELFGNREPSDLKPLDIDRLRLDLAKRYSRESTKSILSLIGRIARYGASKKLCAGLPFPVILKGKTLGREVRIKKAPTDEEFEAFVKACETWPNRQEADFMLLIAFTGIRRSSARNLKWADIDFDRGTAILRDSKTGDIQIVLGDDAVTLLRSHPKKGEFVFSGNGPGGMLPLRTINTVPRMIANAGGLPADIDPCHGFRRRLATKVEAAFGVATAMKVGGWKTPAMVLAYASVEKDTVREAANLLGRNSKAETSGK